MSEYKSEAGHWYDREGNPQYTIVGANGKERNTTLRDARKEGFVPSVTTIIDLLAKPSLENWKIDRALEAAIQLNRQDDEADKDYINRCKVASKEIGVDAAREGTKIHAIIEKGFLGHEDSKIYNDIKYLLDKHFPGEQWIAEASFASKMGYGGKIDLYSKSGVFVDFKTKDNLEGKDISKMVYDSYGMQLSAYAQGCEFVRAERVSLFVDRKDTDIILMHHWSEDTFDKHREMFNSLLTYWKLVKNYDSAEQKAEA